MKSENKSAVKKKELKKLHRKEKNSVKGSKDLKKGRIDTDFHHEHPFKEN